MSMMILLGCASLPDQIKPEARLAPEPGPPDGVTLPVEKRGNLNAVGFNMWQGQVMVSTPGNANEIINADWSLLTFEGDRTILTLQDRRLEFSIETVTDREATEDLVIASVEFTSGQELTINFPSGRKEQLPRGFIQFLPELDLIAVREYKGSDDPIWEKLYRR